MRDRRASPFELSLLAWVGGGVLGAVLSREHRIAGAALGALIVGAVGDVVIERHFRRALPIGN